MVAGPTFPLISTMALAESVVPGGSAKRAARAERRIGMKVKREEPKSDVATPQPKSDPAPTGGAGGNPAGVPPEKQPRVAPVGEGTSGDSRATGSGEGNGGTPPKKKVGRPRKGQGPVSGAGKDES